jgi:ATP-dependent 26S proteasome regulatory subunit
MNKTNRRLLTDVEKCIVDPSVADQERCEMLLNLLLDESKEARAAVGRILTAAGEFHGEAMYASKIKTQQEFVDMLKNGPLRPATFIGIFEHGGNPLTQRAHVILEDGEELLPVLVDAELRRTLNCGDLVFVDASGRALVGRIGPGPITGETGRLEKRLDHRHILIRVRGEEQSLVRASEILAGKLDSGAAAPGCSVVFDPRKRIGYDVVQTDGLTHFQFLDRRPPPDARLDRDMGAPPPFLKPLLERVRLEMFHPELCRAYHLPRSIIKLLVGTSGSGKTLCVDVLIREIYGIMSEATGTPVADLPPRVLRIRMSEVLSKWLGESDKRLARFFDEAFEIARQSFTGPDGKTHVLPTLVIGEEIDGLARQRGHDTDSVHDRILTTGLQRLDPARPEFKQYPMLFLFTSNLPHLLDAAFFRRIGGSVERFGRLNRRSAFAAVLTKHVARVPVYEHNGHDPAAIRRAVVEQVAGWLFAPNGDDGGMVELTLAGVVQPLRKFRRDFLTGALVERAVQAAAERGCRQEHAGLRGRGVTAADLMEEIHRQVAIQADQITEHNAAEYVDVPEGGRVMGVRKRPAPPLLAAQFHRTLT